MIDGLLVIVLALVLFGVFFFLVVLARMIYVKSRPIKQELIVQKEETNCYEGTYFTRYMPVRKSDVQVIESESIGQTISRKIKQKTGWVIDLPILKLGVSGVLVVIFMLGVVVSLFVYRAEHSPAHDEIVDVTHNAAIVSSNNHTNQSAPAIHDWHNKSLQPVPIFANELAKLREHGVVLVSNKTSSTETVLNQLQQQALQEWTDFTEAYQLKTTSCAWDNLVSCQQRYQGWIFVILPDFWQLAGLDQLLAAGASVLLYDAPFQVASAYTTGQFTLYGLTFEQLLTNKNAAQPQTLPEQLVLLGESELRFGFNSGTIINIARRSGFYKVTSTHPQALALPTKNQTDVGNILMTRLYAATMGKGRLVWMDFVPYREHYQETVKKGHIDSVMASLFSYLKNTSSEPYRINVGKK